MTTTQTTYTITVPIPPMELSKNGRANPFDRNRIYQQHRMLARNEINRQLWSGHEPHTGAVTVYVGWYAHRRPYPDSDNAIERIACYRDAAEETGLVVNDNQVQQTQVAFDTDRDNPRVVLTFVLEGAE